MENILVKTKYGNVKGTKKDGVKTYLGIPFAKKPLGDLRFLPPQELEAWDGILDATSWPNNPAQPVKEGGGVTNRRALAPFSEDCLYLNIFAPDKELDNLPVMVWFYGGGYTTGGCSNNTYDGSNLAKNNDVIVVTANYRVGLFGFMYLREVNGDINTNAGLADAIAILKWVKENIETFGGNKDNVTVFGQSAGSSLINILMISPRAKGLFDAAITQSGSPFNHDEWRISKDKVEEKTWKYLKKVGIETIEDLKNASTEKLLSDKDAYAITEFCPYVDGYYITDELEKCFLEGEINTVPTMVGLTKDEATSLVNGGDSHGERGNCTPERFERTIVRKYDFKEAREFIYAKYGSYLKSDAGYALARFRSDNSLANQLYFAEHLNKRGNDNVYFYEFDHVPPTSDPSFLGAHHGSEVRYIFMNPDKDYGSFDLKVSQVIAKYWTNFARNHNPNSSDLPYWEKLTVNHDNIMHIDYPCFLEKDHDSYTTSMFKKFLIKKIDINNR